ncbi:MAG: phosphoribosylformylglycinamidine cyclo-ligase [Deltaproteobacteria bacterium]|nr:phosphoribosylformylglycinamidine cyclo-ligase [Deltaproteobacteria bacterium]
MAKRKPLTYAKSGVDIDRASRLVERIKKIAKETPRTGVIGDIGGFGGLFSLNATPYERPVLVCSTDGVGTKIKIAVMAGKHDTLGIDLVAMSVNDIAMQGARPLFFLDYLAMGKLDEDVAVSLVSGIGEGCRQANCALIGGETAEMPGMYGKGEYDMAGFAVGIVENTEIIDGSVVGVGNQIIGIGSSGLHSNGYTLVREICYKRRKLSLDSYVEDLGQTLGECLLEPTRIYSETIRALIKRVPVHGMANITGGGILENIPRAMPQSCKAVIQKESWDRPPIFPFLQEAGNVEELEMMRTFNNGLGMVVIVPDSAVEDAMEMLSGMGETPFLVGEIMERKNEEPQIEWA